MELLGRYDREGSEEAFAALVQRHINLVYSVALRHVRIAAHAEEITQVVFVILARQATRLRSDTVLEGWLYETTRLASLNFLRGERRRQWREQEAYMESTRQETSDVAVWHQLAPMLDAGIAQLGKKDRDAVILRFFKEKNLSEVAITMEVTEAAAQRRVHRALEKLRRYFNAHGVNLTTVAIAKSISDHSIHTAPTALAKSVTAVAVAKGASAAASTSTLAKGALKLMAWTKIKTAVVGVGILLLAGTGAAIVKTSVPAGEPSYKGRPLSAWLIDVDYGQPQDKRDQAADAIRHMGARTLPYLLARLAERSSGDVRCRQVTWAFNALGPIAKPAIPKLIPLLGQNPGYAPAALAGIGRDAVPELLMALTNESFYVRDNTAAALVNAIYSEKITPTEAGAAFPIALGNLTYTNANTLFQGNTRWRAAALLGALKLRPEIAVPALTRGLEDSSAAVASQCAWSLLAFGRQAESAVPMLTIAASSTNSQLNLAAGKALDQIERASHTTQF